MAYIHFTSDNLEFSNIAQNLHLIPFFHISNSDDSEFVTREFKKRLTNRENLQHLGS